MHTHMDDVTASTQQTGIQSSVHSLPFWWARGLDLLPACGVMQGGCACTSYSWAVLKQLLNPYCSAILVPLAPRTGVT